MIPFGVVVSDLFLQCEFERMLAEEDHLIQALRLEASHESFKVRIHFGTLRREQHRFNLSLIVQNCAQWLKAPVAIENQMSGTLQETVVARLVPSDLSHPLFIGIRGDACDLDFP